jgi:hypothetical protein
VEPGASESSTITQILQNIEPGAVILEAPVLMSEGLSQSRTYYLKVSQGIPGDGLKSIAGHNILKLSADVCLYQPTEQQRGLMCQKLAPRFMAQFTPTLHHLSGVFPSKSDGNIRYLLFTLPNPAGVEYTKPLSAVLDGRLPRIVERISRRLFVGVGKDGLGFNPNPKPEPARKVGEILVEWLEEGRENNATRRGRLESRRNELIQDLRSWYLHDTVVPDPLSLYQRHDLRNKELSCYSGILHGDLHPGNILCAYWPPGAEPDPDAFWLIDFADAKFGTLFYDQAYLRMGMLCSLPETLSALSLRNILNGLPAEDGALNGNVLAAIQAIHDVVSTSAINSIDSERMNTARVWTLACFAAGLNWAAKNYDERDRYKPRRALLAAAYEGRTLLSLLNLPPHISQPPPTPIDPTQMKGSARPKHGEATSKEASLSGLLIVNALLMADVPWLGIEKILWPDTFRKLRNGISLSADELDRLEQLADSYSLFRDTVNIRTFLRLIDSDLDGRLSLVGERKDSRENAALRGLILNKQMFQRAAWLDDVKENLLNASRLKEDESLSLRTWNLRKAYYYAGIRLTAHQMADAAIAEFSDERWQSVINTAPSQAHKHLRAANIKIAEHLAAALTLESRGGDAIRIIEGGVGGGHTTFYILQALAAKKAPIEYCGMELVPALAEEVDAMLRGRSAIMDERSELFSQLKIDGRLFPLFRSDGRMVVAGSMEDTLCDLWDERKREQKETEDSGVDAFVASFAFHHVPNGEAIIKYIANDAQGFEKTLDREGDNKEAVAEALAQGCTNLYNVYRETEQLDSDTEMIEVFAARRGKIIESVAEECPQAAVFLSLIECAALSRTLVDDFCNNIRQYKTYPEDLLRLMLRNPQREVLLTARSLLRDGGVLAVADPDGTSDFNAENAYHDHELTIANFLNAKQLKSQLEEMGFDGIRVFRLRGKSDPLTEPEEESQNPLELLNTASARNLGYIVFARRDMRREREMAGGRPRSYPDAKLMMTEKDKAAILKVGTMLRASEPSKAGVPESSGLGMIVSNLFTSPDPMPHSGQVFRKSPKFRRLLHSLGWLQLLPGSTVLATRRIHIFPALERSPEHEQIFIATDFPETSQEIRNNSARVFSHSDEANALRAALDLYFQTTKEPSQILDLCSGAGTLGILCAARTRASVVYSVDSQERAVRQAKMNRLLNGIDEARLKIERAEDGGNPWSFPSRSQQFGLIVADPPFLLRSDKFGLAPRPDDGGELGEAITSVILNGAGDHLVRGGKLYSLAYSLLEGEEKDDRPPSLMLNRIAKDEAPNLRGQFKPIEGARVWRFRHDKLIENSWNEGRNLRYLVIRLGDPTRPEAITFGSAKQQQDFFHDYVQWLEGLATRFAGVRFVRGEFTKND